jgi:tagaturonate reductase
MDNQVDDAAGFARDVLDRFRNPFINHKLSSIALNHADKVQVRLVPTAQEFEKQFGRKPPLLSALLQASL